MQTNTLCRGSILIVAKDGYEIQTCVWSRVHNYVLAYMHTSFSLITLFCIPVYLTRPVIEKQARIQDSSLTTISKNKCELTRSDSLHYQHKSLICGSPCVCVCAWVKLTRIHHHHHFHHHYHLWLLFFRYIRLIQRIPLSQGTLVPGPCLHLILNNGTHTHLWYLVIVHYFSLQPLPCTLQRTQDQFQHRSLFQMFTTTKNASCQSILARAGPPWKDPSSQH